ncbi:DUF4344 domain-containing metallopeptidase [Ciceribacter ferrooxidans]|nr:DUF4344 domain-containing metallopeptidase [Ciceribacter ferrooxidans]
MLRKLMYAALACVAFATPHAARSEEVLDLGKLNDEQMTEAINFVTGNAIFVLFHEAGHMLVSELGVPVLGREEDAVDALSSILLLEAHDETLDQAITDSADGWFLASDKSAENGDELAFWDSHGLDEQRAYQMVCMMVGNDAEGFKQFADSIDFPQERREECAVEYAQTAQSWMSLLAPYNRADGKKADMKVTYEKVADEELAAYASMIQSAGLLEVVRDVFAESYNLKDGIRVTAKACGQPNAFWHPGERELTYCYELAQMHMTLIADYLLNKAE